MPAEWERHEATWLAWPHNRSDWPGRFAPIPWVYAEIVRNLSRAERVHILVANKTGQQAATRVLKKADALNDNVAFHPWPTNRVWTRDYGPIFVTSSRGELALVNFGFNAWAKYPDWRDDNKIPARVAQLLKIKKFTAEVNGRPFVLEGGSIDVNGQGTLITTEECLLSEVQQRNPGLGRKQIESALHDCLGINSVLWLERGIVGDDTHGHVDDITRFVRPDLIVTATERNSRDPNYEILAANFRRLRAARDQNGKQLTIIELPMPRPVLFSGQRLPASYANFYIANGMVLVPVFNDPNDRIALNILAEAVSDREVIPIYCGDFIWGLGAIHCATQQQPRPL
jgi:agmatine deiminase